MKIINNYRIEQNGEGSWTIIGIIGLKEEFLFNLNVRDDITAPELKERVELEFKIREIKVDPTEMGDDINNDLSMIRKSMRGILAKLNDGNISIIEKQRQIPVIQQECSASQVLLNTYKTEMQWNKEMKNAKGIKRNV